jgi:hypothetical protein
MTREEQIEEFANSQVDCEFFDDSLYKGIIIGAKWADDNQPCMAKIQKDYELLFLLKKRELIKKACKWLEDIDFDMEYWNSEEGFCKGEFINDFRKAMEK